MSFVGTRRRLGCVPTRWRSNLSRWRQTLFHQNLSNATQRSVLRWVEMIIKIERLLVLFPARHSDCYYDYQLSKAQRSFVDQILTFNSCCCPWATGSVSSGNLSTIDVVCSKARERLKTWTVARCNTVILRQRSLHQSASSRLAQLMIVVGCDLV